MYRVTKMVCNYSPPYFGPQELRQLEAEFEADVRSAVESAMRTPEHNRPATPLPELSPNSIDDDTWMRDEDEILPSVTTTTDTATTTPTTVTASAPSEPTSQQPLAPLSPPPSTIPKVCASLFIHIRSLSSVNLFEVR